MSEGPCFISEWLHTLKLEQYLELFEEHGLYTVADLRALSDEELTKIGVMLPGHRKRILGFLQKSMSLEYPTEEVACRPVPMKRNVFKGGTTSSNQAVPPSVPNNWASLEDSEQRGQIRVPPPIPPRKGCAPPFKFSITPPSSTSPLLLQDSPPLEKAVCPPAVNLQSTESKSHPEEKQVEGSVQLVAPPLPAKRHKVENKSPSKSPPSLPVCPPVVPPRTHVTLLSSSPPSEAKGKAIEEIPDVFPIIAPKPFPKVPPRDLPPKQVAPREVPQPPREVPQPPTEVPQPPTEVPQPPTEVPQPPTEVPQPPTEVIIPPREVIIPPREVIIPPREVIPPVKEVLPKDNPSAPREVILPPREVVLPTRDVELSCRDVIPPTREVIPISREVVPQPTEITPAPREIVPPPRDFVLPHREVTQVLRPPPREVIPTHLKPEPAERDLGTLYEMTGEIDGVILTGFYSLKSSNLVSDDEQIDDASDYEDTPSIIRSDSDISACQSSSSLSSGVSSTHSYSGSMDDTNSTQHSVIIKTGWLDKNPPQGSYIFQKRWVKLDLDYLRYYESEKDMYSNGFIKTNFISEVTPCGDQKFEVRTSNRDFVFRAESDADRNDWVKAFKQVVQEKRNRLSTYQPVAASSVGADKSGLLELRGFRNKVYVEVVMDKVFLYKSAEDRASGVGLKFIDMNLGSVKDCDRRSFDLTTPYKTFSFSSDSESEKADWVEAMLQSIGEALSNLEVAQKIWSVEGNRRCSDCNGSNPDWASINLCVVMCKRCAGEHRSLGPNISKVRSLKMDHKVWTPELIELFQKVGNAISNRFWAANVPPSEAIDVTSSTQERKKFILAKYREGKYRQYHQLFGNQAELDKALCAAVTTSDLAETQALLFCGADVNCSTCDPAYPTPIKLAEQAGQRLQTEFLMQNRMSEIPRLELGTNIEKEYYVVRPNITHNGFLHKTSSMNRLVTERKSKEEFSRRWCVLSDGVFSYYENNLSSTPNGEIKMGEIVCVAVNPTDTHGFESTFEIYTQSERLYLFAAETPEEAREWVKSITKCFLPLRAEELLSYDFDRIGRLQYKGGLSLERTTIGWFSLYKTKLYMYLEDGDTVDVIHLKKLSELSIKDKDILVLVAKGRITYILAARKLDFSGWVNAIQKASSSTGDTLSEQQLTGSDVPVLVHKCIDHISQFGMASEGIYRKSGQTSKTTSLLEALKKDARTVVLKEDEHHVDNVSDTLKRFFRGLEEGIFGEHCQDWLNVPGIDDECMRFGRYQELLQNLPQVNRATLKALITHLYCIKHFSDENQMNVHNLAIVFGPTLFQTDGQNYKPGRVVEDLITYFRPIFGVSEQELQKQLNVIKAIIKLRDTGKPKHQSPAFICTVYLEEKGKKSEHSVQIPANMSAEELTKTVLGMRGIHSEATDYWGCSEVDEIEETERPLHFSEKVLHIFHSDRANCNLVVKKHEHMDAMLTYINSRVGDSKNGPIKFREEKSLLGFGVAFHERYFMLNSTMLRMYREIRSGRRASLSAESESHRAEKEWPMKNLTIYLGIKKKMRPPSRNEKCKSDKNDKQEKTQWYLAFDTEKDMREWFAALTFVQHGSLWPEEGAILRPLRTNLETRLGNMSLIPIRGNENDIRRSLSQLTIDPVSLLGNV
ncbi:arf-GAP with Rho-GAP domain, ANK repeat and PH domain-containing protein 1 isoform X4 [Xenopus laevis]|uniref:Arf-GAP with Rho-GAP domain, ANK repeat and PH domain-containing protein 1 isoform X4 n=2 Tax=Xenopus laevis TaxID=8355 RepID=A0A8J1MGS6_XENLA|nr:arf-GAP with Rho-GAP domain, ANK repeat and PH domain-containing protein 1 isoform X4 [Xenopus laevis]